MSPTNGSSKNGTEGLCTHIVTQGPSAFFCFLGRGADDWVSIFISQCLANMV